jgi:two-component system, cell cycle sensor histidine kinase and response regulator CckA
MQTLLVVDDDEKIVQMVQELLELRRYEILSATSPEDALRVLDTHPGGTDLLITDVVMPGTSGYALSEKARKLRPRIHDLFMSGFVVVPAHYGLSAEERGFEAGASILAKPFSGARLHEKICEVLGSPSSAFRPPSREPALGGWPSKRPSRLA